MSTMHRQPRTLLARCGRHLRRAARLLAVFVVMLSVFGSATALAAEALARATASVPACCPKTDVREAVASTGGEWKERCPCCAADSKSQCPPVCSSSVAPPTALAPALENALKLPDLVASGLLAAPQVSALAGRSAALRLERPPRA